MEKSSNQTIIQKTVKSGVTFGRVHGVGGVVIFVLSILCAALILRDRCAYPKLYAARENAPEQNGIRS